MKRKAVKARIQYQRFILRHFLERFTFLHASSFAKYRIKPQLEQSVGIMRAYDKNSPKPGKRFVDCVLDEIELVL